MNELLASAPVGAIKVALVLALAFFVGLEREEAKQRDATLGFGGVRLFPLIGLVSYGLALVSSPGFVPWVVGFGVIGGFMLLSYRHKVEHDSTVGVATEMSALLVYVIGGLVQYEHYWIATTLGVVCVLLLELKKGLEGLTKHVASTEIITAAKFLVLAAVILPVIPAREITRFQINPFRIWLVVVAVSGISFASYVLQKLLEGRGGLFLSAILGGVYSSTVTTVVLARQAKGESRPHRFAGAILTASGVMYARLVVLVALFNRGLALRLAPVFLSLGAGACVVGWLVSRRAESNASRSGKPPEPKNPLELGAAFLFALIFVVVLILTSLAREYLGRAGLYSLAAVMGVTDVDPFILGLTQSSAASVPLPTAAAAILIAAASNNVVKGIYAYSFADRATGRASLGLLAGLAALGLIPLAWM